MLTFIAAAGAGALGISGILKARTRFRPRRTWEPTFADSYRYRKTNWPLVGLKTIKVSQIEEIIATKGLWGLDSFMWSEFGFNGQKWRPGDWRVWSINWRHGCLDRDGTFLDAGWAKTNVGEAVVFFYHMPLDDKPKALPKPDPVPLPEPPSLWTPADELRNALSFLRSPSAFWLAPDGKVPALRFYDGGKIVNAQNGASVEGLHADLTYRPSKKLRYIVTTCGNGEEWKQRRFRTMEAAEAAIQAYFEKIKDKEHKAAIERIRPKVEAIKAQKTEPYGRVYTYNHPDGNEYIFHNLREAMDYFRSEGWTEDAIRDLISGGGRYLTSAPVEQPFNEFKASADLREFGKAAIRFTTHDENIGRVERFLADKHVTAWHVEYNGDTTYHFTAHPEPGKTTKYEYTRSGKIRVY